MRRFSFGLVLSLFFCAYIVQAQDDQLTTLSSNINSKLLSLKDEIRSWNDELLATTTRLEAQSELLKTSESEVEEWKAKSTRLSASLTNINEELTNSHALITQLRTKLSIVIKFVIALACIIVIRTICMVIGFIVAARGIKLPRWLDILI